MRGRDCRQAGFTLIELLVTITIIVLVTGGSMAAYLTFNENRQLDVDARNLNTLLNKIRSRAVFLEYPDSCTGLLNFEVSMIPNVAGELTTLSFRANCSNGSTEAVVEEILKSSTFVQNVSLVFLPISGKLETLENAEIVIQSTKGASRTKKIIIDQNFGTNNVIEDEE